MPKLTNKAIRELLVNLGFEPGELAENNHRVFRHSASGSVLLVPDNKSSEAPRPVDLVGIRTHLAYQGHLNEREFDRFVEQATLPVN
jgi:hypothetical protein